MTAISGSPINAASLLAMRNQILQQNSALRQAAGVVPGAGAGTTPATGPADFSTAMKGALEQVNGLQAKAEGISNSYERGETTDIAAVMLAREQASIGFQATLQVRNKLLSAYRDIMSMPV